jgi:hypothetical protein
MPTIAHKRHRPGVLITFRPYYYRRDAARAALSARPRHVYVAGTQEELGHLGSVSDDIAET